MFDTPPSKLSKIDGVDIGVVLHFLAKPKAMVGGGRIDDDDDVVVVWWSRFVDGSPLTTDC